MLCLWIEGSIVQYKTQKLWNVGKALKLFILLVCQWFLKNHMFSSYCPLTTFCETQSDQSVNQGDWSERFYELPSCDTVPQSNKSYDHLILALNTSLLLGPTAKKRNPSGFSSPSLTFWGRSQKHASVPNTLHCQGENLLSGTTPK